MEVPHSYDINWSRREQDIECSFGLSIKLGLGIVDNAIKWKSFGERERGTLLMCLEGIGA